MQVMSANPPEMQAYKCKSVIKEYFNLFFNNPLYCDLLHLHSLSMITYSFQLSTLVVLKREVVDGMCMF